MDFKLVGSTLLIVGTSIGAGMLALPIATAQLGFIGSLILLIACWLVMTFGAYLLLEVNLWMPQNSNLITMARKTIGMKGQIISWIIYFSLLYSLLCAYISGGSDLFQVLLKLAGISIPQSLSAIVFTLLFGLIVSLGIRSVDYTNRALMFVKFMAYFILIILLIPFIHADYLATGQMKYLTSATAITVTITSFGYAAIVPSLRVYFAGDIKKLKQAILIGSLIPLFCYIAWDFAIMGIIPFQNHYGLFDILKSHRSTSEFVQTLSSIVNKNEVTFFAKLFTSICVLTSFLGVGLCLADFLADGLQLEKKGGSQVIIHGLTFLPPLIVVLFFPNIFIKALQYAGIYTVILLILLPAWMVWNGRYQRHVKEAFIVPGGRPLLIFLMILSMIVIIWGLIG